MNAIWFWSSFFRKLLTCFVLFNIVGLFLESYRVTHPLIGLNIYQNLKSKGYTVEKHIVQTEDGYLLTVQRIPCGRNRTFCSKSRKPVFIMHGMTSSAYDWVCRGTNNSLPLLLAEKGFDVWLGNSRGSTLSRKHTTLDPDRNPEFWDYSYNEMGTFDLPAVIDYILNVTENEKLTYIGYSQGFTQLLVMGAERPEYNDKILLACGMAPVINMYNITNPLVQLAANHYKTFIWITKTLNIHKVLEHHSLPVQWLNKFLYSNSMIFELLVIRFGLQYLIGSSNNIDRYDAPYCVYNWPASKSIKQFAHYLQGYNTGRFSKFDYGYEENLKVYNSSSPPEYDLTKVSMPLALYYSTTDKFINNEDNKRILSSVPNIVEEYEVPNTNFDHLDFGLSSYVKDLVYDPLIKTIEKYHGR